MPATKLDDFLPEDANLDTSPVQIERASPVHQKTQRLPEFEGTLLLSSSDHVLLTFLPEEPDPATPATLSLDDPSNEISIPTVHALPPSWLVGFAVSALTLLIAIVALRMVPHSPGTDNSLESTYNQSVELRRDAPTTPIDTATVPVAVKPTPDAMAPPAARNRASEVTAPRPTPTVLAAKPANPKINPPTGTVTRREVMTRTATTSASPVRQSTPAVTPPRPPSADAMIRSTDSIKPAEPMPQSTSLRSDNVGAMPAPVAASRPLEPAIPPTTPAPETHAATTVAAVAPRVAEESAVRDVLGRYVRAYGGLNVSATKAVWPSVDTRALGRAFAGLESQALYFADCQISMAIVSARAKCFGTAEFVPRVGNRSAHRDSREWTFEMKKAGDQWTIARVDVH